MGGWQLSTMQLSNYATFNYVVKLNGTQTDTYSATYTPPPTPTFDIALTNDDLAITATLTNIVNPDPYYTLMIHDANDAHLDGHTFATGDTTVVLTWTETSYGEKTYTKLLNGASIGTETITLTDPNTPTTPTFSAPETTIDILSGWQNYNWIYDETLNGVDNWTYKLDVANSFRIHFYYNNADGSRWVDGDGDPASISQSGDTITMNIDGNANHSTFIDPYYGKVYEAPFIIVNAVTFTGGSWSGVSYEYRITSGTKLVYTWYRYDTGYLDNRAIVYDTSNNTWADAVGITGYGGNIPDIVSVNNETISLIRASDELLLGEFTDPYYEAPIVEPEILTSVGSYAWSSINEYRHRLSTATHEIYDLWNVANDDWDRTDDLHSIAVDISTNTWEDYGDATPYIVVENADGTVSVSHDTATDIKYKFIKPTTASWIVEPQTLPNINSALWSSVYELRWWSSTETHELYSLYEFSTENWRDDTPSLYSIKVDKATNTWTDNGTSAPHLVTEQSNGTIAMNADGGLVYRFTKPTSASWL